ncbi:MAG TPA: hypothetical protein VIG55_06290 [Methylosinus sp.]|jgi:hypothetical protein
MPTLRDAELRRRSLRNRCAPTHKFALGEHVICEIGVLAETAPSRIVRLLPDGGAGFQYRICGDRDGVERVVPESAIIAAG